MTAQNVTIATLAQEANKLALTENEQPDRFKVESVDSVYDAPAPLNFIVEGLLTKGSVNLIVGEGGSKKTWTALDLACQVARGEEWLDFQTRQAPVLIIDEESGPRRLRRRLYETLSGHFVKREDAPPIYFVSLAMVDARSQDDISALHVLIEQYGAGLVIIDSLADIMPGADENAVKDVQPVFLNLRRIAEATQAAILVIHHANKQNGYRGSTGIKAACDLMLMVESKPESKYITFSAEKTRDIEPKTFTAVANFAKDSGQFWLSSTEVNPRVHYNKGQRYVLRFLLERGDSELDDITINADICAPATAKTAVYALVESGHLKRTDDQEGRTGRGNKSRFDLTEKGRTAAEGL